MIKSNYLEWRYNIVNSVEYVSPAGMNDKNVFYFIDVKKLIVNHKT